MLQMRHEAVYLNELPGTVCNPALPVLLYRGVIAPSEKAKARQFEAHFAQNNWGGSWRDIIYPYEHFHSNAHEALGIAAGTVKVELGGENGRRFELQAGDMLVLPAGTAHRALEKSDDLMVVGAYPHGQAEYDMCTGNKCTRAPEHIAKVALPKTDPFFGPEGPLVKFWY